MRVVILGGGISGLAAAWYCKQKLGEAVEITLLERTGRLGGWIQTLQHEDFLFELGPRSCRSYGNGAATLRLIEELGLQADIIAGSKASRRRFIYTRQQLQPLPQGPLSFLFSPLARPLIRPLLREWWKPRGTEEESIDSFFKRRLGSYAAEMFIDPLVAGIFAGDSSQLSMNACFPQIYQWEQEHGSILKGMLRSKRPTAQHKSAFVDAWRKQGIFSLRRGMQQLVDTLRTRVDADVRLGCEAASLEAVPEGVVVHTACGERIEADQVIACLPAPALARLLPSSETWFPSQRMASVAVVCCGYREHVLAHKGFGYLIPSSERERLLGVVWDSSVFPEHNQSRGETRLTCMIGGEHMADFASQSADDFIAMAREGLERHLGIARQPDAVTIKLATHAIPQYTLGHTQRVAQATLGLQQYFPRIALLGNSYHGVAVNDCIAEAARLFERRD